MSNIPQTLQSVLWSKDISTLDYTVDAPYIIHQVLSHGVLEDIRWLFTVYTPHEIQDTFVSHPYKDYRASRFSFITKFFLSLSDQSIDPRLYVANTPRNIRYR